jgi:hypothetical protein
MAATLRLYQQQEGLTDKQLAQHLGASQALLLQLALCKRPDPTSQSFAAQVRQLAEYTGIEANKLSDLIRQVESLRTEASTASVWWRPASPFLQAAVFRFRVMPFPRRALLACACVIAFTYLGVSLWQSRTTHLSERSAIAFLPGQANAPTDTTSAAPEGSTPKVEAVGGQLPNPRKAAPRPVFKPDTRLRTHVEREARLLATVSVDLDEYKTMRDPQRSSEARKMIRLPQSRTRIVFNLPEGLVRGAYSIFIVDAFNKPLVSGKARSTNGKTLMVILDTTSLEAKTYRLCITRAGEAPNYYQVVIEKR